jgi:hypothetical protein
MLFRCLFRGNESTRYNITAMCLLLKQNFLLILSLFNEAFSTALVL